VGGKWKRPGGFQLNSHLLPLESKQRQRRGQPARPVQPTPVVAGVPGVDGGRGQGRKEEGGEGYLLRCSPWLGTP
jgi:hypothetical protein